MSTGQCPPVGPYGTNPGEVAADVTIFDCEGNSFALHALCELEGAFVYTFAPWCPACISYASSGAPQKTHAKYKGDSFDMYFIVTATTGKGKLPTKETCADVREKYGLQMEVLFDPDGVTSSQLNMKINSGDLVLTRGAVIKINTADHDAVDEALADVFGY